MDRLFSCAQNFTLGSFVNISLRKLILYKIFSSANHDYGNKIKLTVNNANIGVAIKDGKELFTFTIEWLII